MTIHYFNFHTLYGNTIACMSKHIYSLPWVIRRDNFHYVSKSIDCKLCNDLQCVDICINKSLYHIDKVQSTQFIFKSSCLLCLCQCICFQYISLLYNILFLINNYIGSIPINMMAKTLTSCGYFHQIFKSLHQP